MIIPGKDPTTTGRIVPLTEAEIDLGRAISANIEAQQRMLAALVLTEKLYIDQLRSGKGLDEFHILRHWEIGFEETRCDG